MEYEKELIAMQAAYDALKTLAPDELQRAFEWLKAKLNADNRKIPPK
jgi:hypothetical protein